MLARKALAGTAGAPKEYVEDVFSTYLYTGNASTQTITNNIDISGKGGLVWTKSRSNATGHVLFDTERGLGTSGNRPDLHTELQDGQVISGEGISSFNSNGYTLENTVSSNGSGRTFVSWTFRKAKKFFDVVTYTGNGTARTISHNLGSVPGCIIVKRTDTTGDWQVYHRANTANPETDYLVLNSTAATADSDTRWNDTAPTSTVFSVGTEATVNANGGTYVAYLFAHDAGGFGASGSDNVISCGSFTTNGSGEATVTLNYEPQWLLLKPSSTTGNWLMVDTMRGWNVNATGNIQRLRANLSDAEDTGGQLNPTSTGFKTSQSGALAASSTYIYIAIRRGPMKTPTSGTSVFSPQAWTGNGTAGRTVTCGFSPDLFMGHLRGSANNNTIVLDKLRGFPTSATGSSYYLLGNATDAEADTTEYIYRNNMDGIGFGTTASGNNQFNGNTFTTVGWFFQRAPGFFDVVCYTGTGSARTVSHNLGVAPELIIVKARNNTATWNWPVYNASIGNTKYLYLNDPLAADTFNVWNDTSPTSSVFSLSSNDQVNSSTYNYVAYLFASVTGVSKVFSYTGNGSSQTINCGFTAGARFILIKRTDSTGDWYVYDSARGIVSGNDPQLKLNSTAAEATGYDAIDPDNSGFIVNNDATNFPINVNNATYIGLAIA